MDRKEAFDAGSEGEGKLHDPCASCIDRANCHGSGLLRSLGRACGRGVSDLRTSDTCEIRLRGSLRTPLVRIRTSGTPIAIELREGEAAFLTIQQAGIGRWVIGGCGPGAPLRPGQGLLAAPGRSVRHDWPAGTDVLAVDLSGRRFDDLGAAMTGPQTHHPFRDAFAASCASQLWCRSSDRTDGGGDRFADAILDALTGRLAALAQDAERPAPVAHAGLPPGTLARVKTHVEDRLDEPLPIEELAAVAGMPHFQFCRAFKESTGEPPYRYVLGRRVARARELVTSSPLPLAEIAYACGFSSQAHMTTTFTKMLGASPGRLRRRV